MIDLPQSLIEPLQQALHQNGVTAPISAARALSGGCINNARRLSTSQGEFFLKWNATVSPEVFSAEAHGLKLLESSSAVRVPNVLAVDSSPNNAYPPFLLLEWVGPKPGQGHSFDLGLLGEQLASLHQNSQKAYGLDQDNFIGSTQQNNHWEPDWVAFFRDHRLRPQIELAASLGNLTAQRRRSLEALLQRLDSWLAGVLRKPSLLHGDLWSGNVMSGPQSEPVLIDPAVYYGDREAEIAYTELFGGFSSRFYQAYESVWSLEPGYSERRDLYNIYHLLNHLNLFGEGYGSQIDLILHRYVG